MDIIPPLKKLQQYVEKEDLKGYDPYDALNSPILKSLAFNQKYLMIAFIQTLKRLPVNLRPVLGIKRDYNPKGMGLFLSGYLKLFRLTRDECYLEKVEWIIDWLRANRSESWNNYSWGYNFDWQSRAFFIPKGTPTIVNTSFVANAFLDAYEVLNKSEYLDIARSSCRFILMDLNRWEEDGFLALSYSPGDYTRVHNANMLGAAMLARVYNVTREEELRQTARKIVNYVTSHQRQDGSWYYAETDYQRWIDSFHTGFIVESLYDYLIYACDQNVDNLLRSGLDFYSNHFFSEEGIPWYYHDRSSPIDIHSAAQGIVTLSKLSRLYPECLRLAGKIVLWTIEHMQSQEGYFFYRKGRFMDNRIPYIRWAQAWMFHALTTYFIVAKDAKQDDLSSIKCQG